MVIARFQRLHHFRRSCHTRDQRCSALGRVGLQCRGHPRGDDETGTGSNGCVKLLAVEHGTSTDHGIRHRLGNEGDGIERHRGAQSDSKTEMPPSSSALAIGRPDPAR